MGFYFRTYNANIKKIRVTTAKGDTASRKVVIIGKRFNDVSTYDIAFVGDDGRKAVVEINFKARDGKVHTARFQLADASYKHEYFIVGIWKNPFMSAGRKMDKRIKMGLSGHKSGVTHWVYPKNHMKK